MCHLLKTQIHYLKSPLSPATSDHEFLCIEGSVSNETVSEFQFCDETVDCIGGEDEPADCSTGILIHIIMSIECIICSYQMFPVRLCSARRGETSQWQQDWRSGGYSGDLFWRKVEYSVCQLMGLS